MIGLLCIAAWLFLLFFWGGFWRADQRLRQALDPETWPSVVAIIPARDEAASIGEVVRAHRATDYPGTHHLIVVDDSSSDGTGEIARRAGAAVVEAPPLAPGWSGKLWSLQCGIDHLYASRSAPKWILFTDADILHKPDTLRCLVAHAEANDLALASLMARLDNRGFWGQLLIPAFVFFFQKLYPFTWVNRPGHWCAAAAGSYARKLVTG